MALTDIDIYLDREEYSRFERTRSTVRARIVPTPATGLDDTVTVTLERADGFVLATQTVTFSGDFAKGQFATFDLAAVKDADGFPAAIRGNYRIKATSGDVTGLASFRIALITVDELKATYCRGLSLRARDVLVPRKQPSLVTGVTITRVSQGLVPGVHTLTFVAGTPNTLRFDKGPAVTIGSGMASEILPDERGNYVEVVIDPFELPTANAAEGVLIDFEVMGDEAIRSEIEKAISEIENRWIGTYLEPLRIATPPFFNNPEQGEYFDKVARPTAFYRNDVFTRNGKVWHVSLPYTHLQKVYGMQGFFGDFQSLDITTGVYKCNVRQGTIDVLPQSSAYVMIITFFAQLDYWGVREYIADFWRYKALVGLADTEEDLLKAAGYLAAIPVLTTAGQAARGGYSSESISKDGVSRSTSVSKGLYGDTIAEYKEWLKENRPSIGNRYKGINMVIM